MGGGDGEDFLVSVAFRRRVINPPMVFELAIVSDRDKDNELYLFVSVLGPSAGRRVSFP